MIPFEEYDRLCAEKLGIPVEEYIKKIESLEFDLMVLIIYGLLSDDPGDISEAKIMFEDNTKNYEKE